MAAQTSKLTLQLKLKMDCAKTAALKKTLQKEKDLHAATRQLLEEEKASTAEKCEQATQELNDEKTCMQ